MGIIKNIQKFGKFIFNIKDKVIHETPLTPEDIRSNQLVRELALKLQARDAQAAIKSAEEKEGIEEEKEKQLQEELKQKLQEQRIELKEKRFKNCVSFNEIYTKFKKLKIDITDRNDKKVFGIFGDFRISEDGDFCIVDSENNLIAYGKTLDSVVYKPESLINHIRRGRIPIPYDENFKPLPDLEKVNVPEISLDRESGKYTQSVKYQEPFIQAIIKREDVINDQSEEIERLEEVIVKFKRRLSDLERSNRLHEFTAASGEVAVSKALDHAAQFTTQVGDIHKRMVTLQEYNVMHEKSIEGLQQVADTLREQSEEMGKKTEFRKALLLIEQLLRNAKDLTPRVIHEHHEPEPIKPTPVQPGQPIT